MFSLPSCTAVLRLGSRVKYSARPMQLSHLPSYARRSAWVSVQKIRTYSPQAISNVRRTVRKDDSGSVMQQWNSILSQQEKYLIACRSKLQNAEGYLSGHKQFFFFFNFAILACRSRKGLLGFLILPRSVLELPVVRCVWTRTRTERQQWAEYPMATSEPSMPDFDSHTYQVFCDRNCTYAGSIWIFSLILLILVQVKTCDT